MPAVFNVTLTPTPPGNDASATYAATALPAGVALASDQQTIAIDFRVAPSPVSIQFTLLGGYTFRPNGQTFVPNPGGTISNVVVNGATVSFAINAGGTKTRKSFKHSYWVRPSSGNDLKVDPIIEIQDN